MSRTALVAWNVVSSEDAALVLLACCASRQWAGEVVAKRPIGDLGGLIAAARSAWDRLDDDKWRALIASHDRIADPDESNLTASSRTEQSAVYSADRPLQKRLFDAARKYEDRFGFMFVTAAFGRSSEDILRECELRIGNDAGAELTQAALQHRLIAERRLRHALGDLGAGTTPAAQPRRQDSAHPE